MPDQHGDGEAQAQIVESCREAFGFLLFPQNCAIPDHVIPGPACGRPPLRPFSRSRLTIRLVRSLETSRTCRRRIPARPDPIPPPSRGPPDCSDASSSWRAGAHSRGRCADRRPRLLDQRDAALDRADQGAQVAADAFGFVDDELALAVYAREDRLVRGVLAHDVAAAALDAELLIDLSLRDVVEVEILPVGDQGIARPRKSSIRP